MLQQTPETMPVIEVRLAPPSNPFPEISRTIASLEKKREALEQEKMSKVQAGYRLALNNAGRRIEDVVGSATAMLQKALVSHVTPNSFLETRSQAGYIEGPSVKVKLLEAAEPDSSIGLQLEKMEEKRSSEEANMLDRAVEEMSELTDIVIAELKKCLQQQISALQVPTALSFITMNERGAPASLHPVP